MARTGGRAASAAIVIASLSLSAGLACSTVRVSTDYDPSVEFARLQTYDWLDERSGVEGDREDVRGLLDRRIRSAVEDELSGKGLSRDDAAPDLLVTYQLAVDTKLDIDTLHTGLGYGRGWYGGGLATSQTIVREYDEGTLLIDLVDPASRQLVWRGTGVSRVRDAKSPEQREEIVRDTVSRILESFPPTSVED